MESLYRVCKYCKRLVLIKLKSCPYCIDICINNITDEIIEEFDKSYANGSLEYQEYWDNILPVYIKHCIKKCIDLLNLGE